MNDNFYEMSAKMKELFPSNPAADKKALMAMAGNQAPTETPIAVRESVDVPQGSLQIDKDYSVSDFAALAGVKLNETQKTGSAGQAKGKDPTPKMSKPSNTGEQPHPLKDKLVGEASPDEEDKFHTDLDDLVHSTFGPSSDEEKSDKDRIAELEKRVEALEAQLSERSLTKGEEKEKERIVKGMKKNKSDFKDRYGKDAEAVMYATATKNAKKNESIKDQLLKMLEEKKQK
jgi:hypothetical protein